LFGSWEIRFGREEGPAVDVNVYWMTRKRFAWCQTRIIKGMDQASRIDLGPMVIVVAVRTA